MYYFLDYLEPFKEDALQRFRCGEWPRHILFSSSTYQLSFHSPEGANAMEDDGLSWVFMQLDPKRDMVNDLFCSCSSCQEVDTAVDGMASPGCIHMALAFCTVFQGGDKRPLHERFYSSSHLHRLFFSIAGRRNGKTKYPPLPTFEKKAKESICIWPIDENTELLMKGDHSYLDSLKRALATYEEEETEENSIKFSTLSDEELEMWRDGNPSPSLSYELSPLSECAKWLFIESIRFYEKHKKTPSLTLLFDETSSKPQYGCRWDFGDEFSCSLNGILLHELVDLLEGISKEKHLFQVTPDVVSCSEFDVSTMRCHLPESDEEQLSCSFSRYKVSPQEKKSSLPLFGDAHPQWRRSEKRDLIFKELPQNQVDAHAKEIVVEDPERLEELLDECAEAQRDSLFDEALLEHKITINTRRKELIISGICVLPKSRKKSDPIEISQESYRFGRWIFLPREEATSRGAKVTLVRVAGLTSVPYPEIRVSGASLNDFINQHKFWFSKQRGFRIHSSSEEMSVIYKVDPETQALVFQRDSKKKSPSQKQIKKISQETCDLGRWIWKEGEGFFPSSQHGPTSFGLKGVSSQASFAPATYHGIPLDTTIPPHRVSDLIHSHREALSLLPHFFFKGSPIAETGLKISYEAKAQRIIISLSHRWDSAQYEKEAVIYGEYGHIQGKGFFRIPVLPVQGLTPRIIEMAQKDEWERFFIDQLPQYLKEYSCNVDPRLLFPVSLKLYCNQMAPEEVEKDAQESEEQLFSPKEWDADFFWKSEKGEISLSELTKLMEHGDRFIPTNAGCIDVENDRFLWVRSYVGKIQKRTKKTKSGTSGASAKKKGIRLKTYDVLRIQAHDQFEFELDEKTSDSSYAHSKKLYPSTIIQRLLDCAPPGPPDMRYLNSELRPYQRAGLEWLWFLYTSGLSGLLCDDMGVGKTHQAMALFAAVYASFQQGQTSQGSEETKAETSVFDSKGKKRPPRFLIICPTSLVWHWKEKLGKFLPHLHVYSYFGSDRSSEGIEGPWNIFLTTYGIWRNEVSFLRRIRFDVAVFDELQIAKNHVSLVWASLAQVQASMRLGLTGTPIENQLRELKALFDLVLPGYLPDEILFREIYVRPIERGDGYARKALLARAIKPFVLRRKKEEVLPELPVKTEELFLTELAPDQRGLYRQIASLQGLPLINQLQDESQPIPYMHIFALLSALKQTCNHPACYLKEPENYKLYESGKWQVFQELIEEARESGQKVVVFSQYLTMLDIMALYFQELGIGYTEIRGRTRQRGKAIDQFRDDPSCLVFLGSLQAAGLGIDLTSASIVIHYDRWWNAARENQATDRVHRIGQSRGVQVIKMMTKDTVEERIDQMINRKATLLEEVINYDDHQIVKKMSREELLELLKGIDTA